MIRNVLEYLETSAKRFPEKPAFYDDFSSLSFLDILKISRKIGTYIITNYNCRNKPIAVICNQTPLCIAAFLGIVYSGNFYVPIDIECPQERMLSMINSINPAVVLLPDSDYDFSFLKAENTVSYFSEVSAHSENEQSLLSVRNSSSECDPLFAIFTSGSTGTPKCVVKSHRAMISFIDTFSELFDIDEKTVFGNQTPFYFDASTKDVYLTLKCSATTAIIPKKHFSFPIDLINYLNINKVNTVVWVPSVLTIVSVFRALDEVLPEYLKKVFFVGEVMPVKHLNNWIKHLPDIDYVNLYGTTESAGNCLYYRINGLQDETATLPLGVPFPNSKVFILDENNASSNGEICIGGPCVALGYYGIDSSEKFCQNPVNNKYYERICRTGDLGKIREDGKFEFVSRADFQIKHMGNRIELGDIESAVLSTEAIQSCCCVYNKKKDSIVLYYTSNLIERKELKHKIAKKLPDYMMPNKIIQLDKMPLNANGKIDRKYLLDLITVKKDG